MSNVLQPAPTEAYQGARCRYPKFFELGQDNLDLDDLFNASTAWEATEKMDGSLGLLFFDDASKEWRLKAKRGWTAEQGEWAEAWMSRQRIDKECLTPGTTYIVEIVFAENLVVVR